MSIESFFKILDASHINPLLLWFSLFFVTFVLEEGAAALAVLLMFAGKLSLPLASTAVYCGVISSDVGLYGLGYSASRFKWAAHWVDSAKLQRSGEWIGQRLFMSVLLSRLLPWMLPPTFIACGFFRLPFKRFFWFASSTGAVWTIVVFGLLLSCGNVLFEHQNVWTWSSVLTGMLLLFVWKAQKSRVASLRSNSRADALSVKSRQLHAAWPAPPTVCWFESLPGWLFYSPIVLFWLYLAARYRSLTLPTAANPSFESGGLVGESKLQVMSQVTPDTMKWFAPHTAICRSMAPNSTNADAQRAMQALAEIGVDFPIVAKPDRGYQGHGVRAIFSYGELADYIEAFPAGETIMLQQLIPFDGEAGVFYVRPPGERRGQIFSLSLSEPSQVLGDGTSTLRSLIIANRCAARSRELHLNAQRERLDWVPRCGESVLLAFARSHRLGATLRDGRQCITPTMLARFDEIADGIHNFCFGRFDVRFRDLDQFQRGEAFQIVEINGVGAEATHIWDPSSRLQDAYRTLFSQFRLAFQIGHMNRARGFKPIGLKSLWHFFIAQHRLLGYFPKSIQPIGTTPMILVPTKHRQL